MKLNGPNLGEFQIQKKYIAKLDHFCFPCNRRSRIALVWPFPPHRLLQSKNVIMPFCSRIEFYIGWVRFGSENWNFFSSCPKGLCGLISKSSHKLTFLKTWTPSFEPIECVSGLWLWKIPSTVLKVTRCCPSHFSPQFGQSLTFQTAIAGLVCRFLQNCLDWNDPWDRAFQNWCDIPSSDTLNQSDEVVCNLEKKVVRA